MLSFQGRTVLKDVLIEAQSSIKHEINLKERNWLYKRAKMAEQVKYSVGLDVDKKYVHACMIVMDSDQNIKIKGQRKFDNVGSGHGELCRWIGKKYERVELPLSVVLEPTGVYHESLAHYLYGAGLSVSIVLGNKVKQYAKSLGLRSKNDRSDARALARMGAERKLRGWQPARDEHQGLKALTRHKERIENLRTDVRNQLESVKHSFFDSDMIVNDLEAQMAILTEQAKRVKKEIVRLINEKDSEIAEDVEKATSIKGVGPMVAAVLLSETNSFEHFMNERQLMSYAGYDIVENQSGSRHGKTRISKKGNAHIRRVLHMAAWQVVMRDVPHFVSLYERVYKRTGVKMKAYVAVQRKLLCTIYALVKKKERFNPKYNLEQKVEIVSAEVEHQVLQS